MPAGDGWFIDLKSGKVIPIYEHATAVAADPAAFRVRPREIKGLAPLDTVHRERILRLVFRRGFARIRADKGRVVV
jgi:hypothetical protein